MYYIDSSIYLNLWKKEIDFKTNKKFWKIAELFLQKIEEDNSKIYYSGFIIKEMGFILGKKFKYKLNIFLDWERFEKIIVDEKDYKFARFLENKFNFQISFFDCMHIVLAKKSKSILVTRDEKLIYFSKGYCITKKPEELL